QLQAMPAIEGTYNVDVLGAEDAVFAHTAFEDAAVLKLYVEPAHTNEDYVFERGSTVFANVTGTQNRGYEVEVFDSNGVSKHGPTACVNGQTAPGSTFSDSYTTLASDPLSTSAEWNYKLYTFPTTSCTGTPSATDTLTFDVAHATAYPNSAL